MAPLISIIMPCYNRESTVAKSIDSVIEQTFTDWELLVVDDGSSDNSREVVLNYDDPRIILHAQKNTGVCGARNAGLKLAAGDMVAFLDADDTWATDCLAKLYHALSGSDASLAYCGWQNIGLPGGQGEPFIPPNYETPEKLELLFKNCRWPIHACLSDKTAIIEAGMFNETIQTSEDFLLWLNIAMLNKIICVPEVLAHYHFHDGHQATADKARLAINHYHTQQLFLTQHPNCKTLPVDARLKNIMQSELLKKGYECYWKRDLHSARAIFRQVMKNRYGNFRDWKYMLPSLLPYSFHRRLLCL
ncbi:MAG: glycosyltransferase family 2 protein [Candidatus Reddybacter sp.]